MAVDAKEGKTYGINSQLNENNNNGIYSITTQVRNEVAYETIISFDRVLTQFHESGITQEQLDKGKAGLKNQRLAIENPVSIIEFYNPILYNNINKRNDFLSSIDAITLDQVNRVIKKYFAPDSYKLILVGDESILNSQIQKVTGLTKLPVTSIEKDN